MEIERATKLLASLADGVNPLTGELLPDDDSCNQVEIVRAIHAVLSNIKAAKSKAKKSQPENAGKPWTEEDERLLCRMYDAGNSKKDICQYFKRTPGAIAARLVRLGKIQNRDQFRVR